MHVKGEMARLEKKLYAAIEEERNQEVCQTVCVCVCVCVCLFVCKCCDVHYKRAQGITRSLLQIAHCPHNGM